MKSLTVALVVALTACANSAVSPEPEANPVPELVTLPLGEVRGGADMAEHSPESLLRALLLPLNRKPSCATNTEVNPHWARCGVYELTDCTRGSTFGFTCDIIANDLAIGSLTSHFSGDTWSFVAHWDEQTVQGVRDGSGAVVVVRK